MEVAWAERFLVFGVGSKHWEAGSREPSFSIQLPASPFPSITSHFLVPPNCHASHPSLVDMAKRVEQQPAGPRLDDEA